ncbi:MAG: hypothetical protein JRN39_00480 [Nitrososphaerota archaeon]|nr:hypothetical protein [Nitrososphaerota archaeon]MDG6938871.1 hypothetical protein [Nitrososphaerota archaeon]
MFAEALVSVTFALVIYQDFKDRLVADWAWIPAAVAVPVMLYEAGGLWWLAAARLGLVAAIAAVSWAAGLFGEADSIAIAAMGIGSSPFSPLLQFLAASAVALTHMAAMMMKHRSFRMETRMSVEDAAGQNVWIPRKILMGEETVRLDSNPSKAWDSLKDYGGRGATVVASYGVPLAGYMAAGYIVFFLSQVLQFYGLLL